MAVKKKAPVKKPGKAIASMKDWESKLAEMARQESAKEVTTESNALTWPQSGGTFEFQGTEIGGEVDVIICDSVYRNTYYDRPYDKDTPFPPACFAIADFAPELTPSENSPVRQADTCAECEFNEFGSDSRGKGKACRNFRKLTLLDAEGEDDPIVMSVPPTSMKSYAGYVKKVEAKYKRPVFGVITRLSFDDKENFAKLKFDFVGLIDSPALMQRVMETREENAEALRLEPDVSGYEPPPTKRTPNKRAGKSRR